jgi:hypothetical protein
VKTDDPMKWWWNHRREYPVLSQVALDYLSVLCKCLVCRFNSKN